MEAPPLSVDAFYEQARLASLRASGMLDTPPEERFDRITRLAARLLRTPMALVTLVDETRQFIKSRVGTDACETARSVTFCTYTIERDEPLVVEDARLDPRFSTNPLVTGEPHIRFYAGVPLQSTDGFRLGALCVVDTVPHEITGDDLAVLQELAAIVSDEIERSRQANVETAQVVRQMKRFQALVESSTQSVWIADEEGSCRELSYEWGRWTGQAAVEIEGWGWLDAVHPEERDAVAEEWRAAVAARATFEREYRVRCPERGYRWLSIRAVPVFGEAGNFIEYVGTATDIDEGRRASQALRESEARFRSLVQNGEEIISLLDTEGVVRYQSPSIERITGHSPSSLTGRNIFALIHPEDVSHVLEVFGALVAGAREARTEFRFQSAEGEWMWMESNAVNFLDDPDVGAVVVNFRNVTEQKLAQQALVESEERYRLVAERTGQLVYDYDVSTGAISWLGAIEEITGCAPEAFQNVDISGWEALVHPDDRPRVIAELEQAFLTGAPFTSSYRLRHAAGSYLRVEERGSWVPGIEGQPVRLIGVIADVTERKRAEIALHESEARYRALSELVQTFAYAFSVDEGGGITLEWVTGSIEDVLGYTDQEILTCSWDHLVDPLDQVLSQERLLDVLSGTSRVDDLRMIRKDGQSRWMRMVAQPEHDSSGRVVRIYGAGQDVTEHKEAEIALLAAKEQAEEVARLKDALLANMSHEIRTPLTSILGFAEILKDELKGEAREFMEIIEISGHRLMETLTSVLELAQINAGAVELRPEPLDVTALVQETLQMFQAQALRKGITLGFAAPTAALLAHHDRGAFLRILSNLVGNAVKFTAQGGVTVHVERDEERLILRVCDTGVGISPAFLPRLFDEFRQESSGSNRTHEGSGLGLAITKRLVELSGGSISVESQKRQGTTFTVVLPRNYAPEAALTEDPEQAAA